MKYSILRPAFIQAIRGESSRGGEECSGTVVVRHNGNSLATHVVFRMDASGYHESKRGCIASWMRMTARRGLLIGAGTMCTGLGIIGAFVPILPTTPFLLLAAACYMRSSERFYRWLVNNRIFGAYVRNYIEGRGIPARTKVFTILLLWTTIGLSIALAVQNTVVRIILLCAAIGVTVHVLLIRKRNVGDARRQTAGRDLHSL